MMIEYCPKCRKLQNMLATMEESIGKNENNETIKIKTVSYQCSVCNTFVCSEDSSQKVNSGIIQGSDMVDNTMINFSGVWVLNLGRSKLQSPEPESSIFNISHMEPLFSFERMHIINGTPDNFAIELRTDGTATKKDSGGVEITAKMYWDGKILVSEMLFQKGDEKATNTVKYSLEDKGETLVADEEFTGSEQKHHNKWVFDKKHSQ